MRVGVISDTHGLLRPEATAALTGAESIVHAGDVGGPGIVEALEAIAPVIVVRGNVDGDRWGRRLPSTQMVELAGHMIYVLHDLAELDLDPAAAGIAVVIYGHSHQPEVRERDGVLYLNPGSAGPRRFHLPVTVAWLDLGTAPPAARIVPLEL